MNKRVLPIVAFAFAVAVCGSASAQVTGDFKVTGTNWTDPTATVSGTVNHGAIQSQKSVAVEISYDYSFVAERTVVIPGETTTVLVFVPGKCVSGIPNRSGCDRASETSEVWIGHYEVSTVTTEPTTTTLQFSGASAMTAITEPTVVNGRLNPKGKVTGYNWTAPFSIVANSDIVDPSLVPEGYTVVSVTIVSISYKAYLLDAGGVLIPDTVFTGVIF